MDMHEQIKLHFNESIQTKITAADTLHEVIANAGQQLVECLLRNNKVLSCGNARSAPCAQLFATSMLNRFLTERPSLPAFALTSSPQTLISITEDYSAKEIFSKQIKALGQEGDILLVVSTTGNSADVVDAVEAAHQRGMQVIALTGTEGGEVASLLTNDDVEIRVPSDNPVRIHETHVVILHCLCDIIDKQLFQSAS